MNCRGIHRAHRAQSIRRRKCFARESAGCSEIEIKLFWLGWLAAFRGVHGCHARIFLFRKTDPEVQIERSGKVFLPIIRQRLSGDSTHEFIEKKSKRARVVTMSAAWWPQRFLRLQRSNYRIIVEHIGSPIQSAKPR